MRALPKVLITVLLPVLVAACSTTTSGSGSGSGSRPASSAASTPDFPSSSTAPGGSSPAPSTSARSTSAAASPTAGRGGTAAQRSAALRAQTGRSVTVVAVPGGYEAAAFDQSGHISFWAEAADATRWSQAGTSTYPYSPALGAPDARTLGALLRGMTHATFVVRGTFTTDGGGNAVAFTTGSAGWGTIKAEANGNIGPSGAAVGGDRIGLAYDFGFADGYLVTQDCPADKPLAECNDGTVVTKQWRWTGHDFVRRL